MSITRVNTSNLEVATATATATVTAVQATATATVKKRLNTKAKDYVTTWEKIYTDVYKKNISVERIDYYEKVASLKVAIDKNYNNLVFDFFDFEYMTKKQKNRFLKKLLKAPEIFENFRKDLNKIYVKYYFCSENDPQYDLLLSDLDFYISDMWKRTCELLKK